VAGGHENFSLPSVIQGDAAFMTQPASWDYVFIGAHLASMVPGAAPWGTLRDAALAVRGERIAWIGPAAEAREQAAAQGIKPLDASGLWLTPGLIDCHTHLIYGGERACEFEQRLLGVSYEQIAREGGGINATVTATRAASDDALYSSAKSRALKLHREGVTTLEIKSGYGLDLETELRLLRIARALGKNLPLQIKTTFLGLHALPREYARERQRFVDDVSGPWLQSIAREGLADAVDAFCESIAFSSTETAQFLRAAQALGLAIHLHAGQLSDSGAAQLASQFKALSADHLEYVDQDGVEALARAGTVAVLLPGAYYTLRQKQAPPVSALRACGVPMAVATDCNPGTSPCTSILLMLNMACTLFGLTAEEAVAGVTRVAAQALGALSDRGTLEVGKRADLALWRIDRPAQLCYGLGANPCVAVTYGGITTRYED
jgi:imidazolonepropionase